MGKEDNATVHLYASRLYRSLKIPEGILGDKIIRLVQDGCILRTLANDPTRQNFRKERLQTLLERETEL